jgi:hypothetical protein
MPDRRWRFGRYIESEQPVEHRRLAIIVPRKAFEPNAAAVSDVG